MKKRKNQLKTMKKTTTMKAFALSLAMALGMLLPTTTNAQNDGFFRGNMDNYENRDAGINSNDGAGISNWGIGEEVPLGSGLLVLAAAGAGYAAMRRKRNKRGVALIIALAMILTMSNCKKNVETISNVTSNGVQITLDVDGGSKVNVNPTGGTTFATVDFESGDIIYVGNNGHYCGYLEHNGTCFTGSIDETNLSNDDYLHFYFIGNKGKTSQPSSVSIADQTSEYPVISYAHSDDFYHGEGSYSAKLNNYCAIAKFPLSGAGTSNAVYVRGMKNMVTINFVANNGETTGDPYTFSREGNGTIKLHSESATEKWAIVLEQGAVTADLLADGFEATTVSVPVIMRNTYHASDISATSLTAGSKVCYSFTSDDKGSVIRFSKGNLQAVGTTTSSPTSGWTWSFATNQYDYIGNATANTSISGNGAVSTNGTVDLFGWSTATTYYGINNSTNDGDYSGDFVDWGGLTIGEYNPGTWRTLTSAEWAYLFDGRSAIGVGTRFAKAYLLGEFHGVILFPDNYTHPEGVAAPTGVNVTGNTSWDANQYNATEWGKMEAAGCVFLPAAGARNGSSVSSAGSLGLYRSSTYIDSDKAYRVRFDESGLSPQYTGHRCHGFSVRLVF